MARVLEFIVACIIVIVFGVVVGVIMPGSGHVERSLTVSKDLRQVYDTLANFRTFPDYGVLRAYDARTQYTLSGNSFGPGSEINWNGMDEKVGEGKLTIAKADPDFNKIDTQTNSAQIIWNVDNDWRGNDKHFTLDLARQTNSKLTKITWSYDVDYGWNLLNRYSNMYIHGQPDAFIQFSLNSLQNMLAAIPNVDYGDMIPYMEQPKATPVLLVPTSINLKDGLIEAMNDAVPKAVAQIQAAAKKLGVNITGPRIVYTTDFGDQTYTFDVAMPIDNANLTVNGQSYQLAPEAPPSLADQAAASSTSASAQSATLNPGDHDRNGRLVIDGNVRAMMAFGGSALMAKWNGTIVGVKNTRDQLEAYAQTHGLKYDDVTHRSYDIEVQPEVKDGSGQVSTYAQYEVYLPVGDSTNVTNGAVPTQTPEQQAGMKQPGIMNAQPASSGTAPAPASSSAAPAGNG
jgi:hypothetical protein